MRSFGDLDDDEDDIFGTKKILSRYFQKHNTGCVLLRFVKYFKITRNSVLLLNLLVGLQIIKGLKEVLIGMKVGGKRRTLIPPQVGYISETLQPIPEEFKKNTYSVDEINQMRIEWAECILEHMYE